MLLPGPSRNQARRGKVFAHGGRSEAEPNGRLHADRQMNKLGELLPKSEKFVANLLLQPKS